MEVSIAELNSLSVDQQRIVVVGDKRKELVKMVAFVLAQNKKAFNHYAEGKLNSQTGAPLILIESDSDLVRYQHHIGVVTKSNANKQDEWTQFADSTPKSGILIYPEHDSVSKSIFSKERPDVQTIPYSQASSELKAGSVFLISSTHEKFEIKIKGDENLLLIGCAKELLKKIGISSSQFYRTIANFS